jgi:hypothetical protein
VLGNSNSRFFTKCYLDPAAFVPPDRRKRDRKSWLPPDRPDSPSIF